MPDKLLKFLYLSLLMLLLTTSSSYAGISFSQNQVKISLPPNCIHAPVNIVYTLDDVSFDESVIAVSSDSSWATPSVDTLNDRIDITFSTENLISSYTATISVDDGETVTNLFIHANVAPLDIYRLLDDPLRFKTYGMHRDGINNGSIVAYDPTQGSLISCVTVGESPTDFVINADSSELLVINSVGRSIDVIDLNGFTLKETIDLPVYSAWGDSDDTTANIDLGPGDIIYYIDGSWGPVLHVLKRSTGAVLQSIIFDGSSPTNNTGFMDIAVTSDKTKMVAMPQYGWSAGSHSSRIGQYSINADGTVNFVKQTSLSSFAREPFEAPVLMRDDDQIAVMKTISTDPADTDNLDRSFVSAIWSMNPNGSVVATGDKLYDYSTGKELYTIPGGTLTGPGYTYSKAQAFTSDYTRFVYFNASNRTLNTVNLIKEIGLEQMGRSVSPADGSVVNSPASFIWSPLSGVDQYDLYLGTDEALITAADIGSPFYIGRITGSSYTLPAELTNGTEYFWRIDPITALGPEIGDVYSFTVSEVALDINEIDVMTIAGHSDFQVDIQLTSETPGALWSVSSANSWVTFTQSSGATPSTINVHLDATQLSAGFHTSTITLSTGSGDLEIPVQLQVDPLNLTHIRNDRNSATTYAISEDLSSVIPRAYLLEIDSDTETIERVIPVGSSVTDFTIHYADNLLYVTNWKSGHLLAIDKSTLEHTKTIAFQPAGATGYSEGDVYRVSAGASQRLVVEEEDQWIDISLFNSTTESTLNQAFVREGGGGFDPTGRYYYHGENNSSGASIQKFDTAGDIFTQLAEVRPAGVGYGSRTIIVSEDGSRIFWSGVALDENLSTEWATGEIIYATSTTGRYAFSETAIYDINLRRQVLAMPTSTRVSGYNSTTEKLMVQVGDEITFYGLSTPISIPAPTLSTSIIGESVELTWTDESLEMEFFVQQRISGSDTWVDIGTTDANVTNWTAGNLQIAQTYEFRVRASASEYSSAWSNIVSATPYKVYTVTFDLAGGTLVSGDLTQTVAHGQGAVEPNFTAPAGLIFDRWSADFSNVTSDLTIIANYSFPPVNTFPYTESFETGFGFWQQDAGDNGDWSLKSGSTDSSNTGPTNAADGSYYLYTEASGSGTGFPGKRFIISAKFDFSSLNYPQMTFQSHMYGAAMGTLTLEASTDGGSNWTPVWSKTGNQVNSWTSERVNLTAYAGENSVDLRFNGLTGSDYTSDMAIDDIEIRDVVNNPPEINSVTVPSTAETAANANVSVSASDADSDSLTYAWSKVLGPGTVTFADANVASTTTSFSVAGDYSIKVVVSDGLDSVEQTASVTVSDPATLTASIADASIRENGGSTIITVTRNSDTTNELVVTLTSSDTGEATVVGGNIPAGQASADFLITAVDDGVMDGTQTVTITASAAGHTDGSDMVDVVNNMPPTIESPAMATPDEITLPENTVTLMIMASDLDGDPLSYSWTCSSHIVGFRFTNATAALTDVTFTQAGLYTFQVTVWDGFDVVEDEVNVLVHAMSMSYNLTVDGGTDDTNAGPYEAGTVVNITANAAPAGKQFAGWTSGNGGTFADAASSSTTFTMPASDVTVTATYEDIPVDTFTLTVDGGTDDTNAGPYEAGTVVNITANAVPAGKQFAGWTSDNGGTFADATSVSTTFTMPAGDVTVTATYIDTVSTGGNGGGGSGSGSGGCSVSSSTSTGNLMLIIFVIVVIFVRNPVKDVG